MSMVDQWDWSKVKPTEETKEDSVMAAHEKIQDAIYSFEINCNIIPNRIIMGYDLANKIKDYNCVLTGCWEEVGNRLNRGVVYEYEGIRVFIDYDNPDNLEVGYMNKWIE